MGKVEKIVQQIEALSWEEFKELRAWVMERDWAEWDERIAADSRAGKLDELVQEARADYEAGRTRKL